VQTRAGPESGLSLPPPPHPRRRSETVIERMAVGFSNLRAEGFVENPDSSLFTIAPR
jgi:hypothetical protein